VTRLLVLPQLDAYATQLGTDHPEPPKSKADARSVVNDVLDFIGRERLIAVHPRASYFPPVRQKECLLRREQPGRGLRHPDRHARQAACGWRCRAAFPPRQSHPDFTERTRLLPDHLSFYDSWTDPLIGLRGRLNLSKAFYLTAETYVGGFGIGSDIAVQVYAALGCQVTRNIIAEVGYRYFYDDFRDEDANDFLYQLALHGSDHSRDKILDRSRRQKVWMFS
jgi:hypothetical protein